jgi:nitrogen-specific signal transduction histidine kinase/PAS domain-containing protein
MLDDKGTRDLLLERLQQVSSEAARYREQYKQLTEINSAILYMVDCEGYFTFINNAVETILNYKPDELLGCHFSSLMPGNEYERVGRLHVLPSFKGKSTGPEGAPKLFDERRTGFRKTKGIEVKIRLKDKDDIRVLAGEVCGIYDPGKIKNNDDRSAAFMGSQGIMYDITRYKKAEKEKMELQRRFLEVQKVEAVGWLASKISHDLNNKLGSIQGCAELLKNDFADKIPELGVYVDTILSASKHASEMSNYLMSIVQRDDSTEDIDLHEVVNEVISLIRPGTDECICVMSKSEAECGIIVGNRHQLQNAILSLVLNAFDAMALEGGNLTFATENLFITRECPVRPSYIKPGEFIVLSISDTGDGMEKAVLDKLFQPFFTTKSIGGGLGLGLASVKDCVRSHGGFINVESEKGSGSVFKLYFPIKESD